MLCGCTIYISNVTTSQRVIYKINTESEHEGLHLANWHAALQTYIYNNTNVVQFSIFLGDRIKKNGALTHARMHMSPFLFQITTTFSSIP